MFGQPHWFRKKKNGWGITPIAWQGWVYALTWGAVLVAPFALLVLREQPIEAIVWLAVAATLLVYDVRGIMAAMRTTAAPEDDVLYIGDDEPANDRLATRNFDFQLRR